MSPLLRRGWLIPVALGLFVDNVRGTPLRAAALVFSVGWAAAAMGRVGRRPRVPLLFGLFLLWAAAGLFFSCYRAGTLGELSLLVGAGALWGGMSVVCSSRPEEILFLPRGLIVLGLAKAAAAFAAGGLLAPGDAGTANIGIAPMFLALAVVAGRGVQGRPWRAAWGVLAAVFVWLCWRWGSTAALLGAVGGLLAAEAFRRRRRWLLGAAVGVPALLLLLFVSPAAPRWFEYNPGNPARFERLAIWRDSLSYAKDHLLLGTALGTFEQHYPQYKTLPEAKTANFAHNDWLQVLCETGLPGTVLALLLAAGLARRLRTAGVRAPEASGALMALVFWGGVYFPFRSDPLLFGGALLLAVFSSDETVPLSPAWARGFALAGAAAAWSALAQGSAQVLERWGGAAWDAGETETALVRFRRASLLEPWEPRHLDHQVECLRRLDRKAETLPLLERAVAIKPRDVWIRRKLATARLHLAGPAAAREAYAPILSLAPNVESFRREYDELNKMGGT